MTDADAIMSPRVIDLAVPYVASGMETCSRCGFDVWVSHAIRADLPDLPVVCIRCADRDPDRTVLVSPTARREALEYLRRGRRR